MNNQFEILINNRFVINKKVGKGSFGDVHLGHDKTNNQLVALKLEHKDNKKMLEHEYNVYRDIGNNKSKIPKIFWYGNEGEYRVMVMEYLGESLESLLNKCGRKMSLKTTMMIGLQIFDLIHSLHCSNYVHRDLKPENFLIGIGDNRHFVHMIDFGLCKRFKNEERVHCKMVTGKKLVGTARYASINSHQGIELSRRDDMESLLYLMIYFRKGTLPWQGMPGKNREAKYEAIRQKKVSTTPEQLCQGLPVEFTHFLQHIRSLDFKEKPKYRYLRNLLLSVIKRNNYVMDFRYDWCFHK